MGSIGGKFPRGYLRKLSSDFEDTKQAAITASMEDAQSKMDVLSSFLEQSLSSLIIS